MAKKRKRIMWNIDKVREFVEGEEGNGCRLLSKEYKNTKENLEFVCMCGEIFKTSLHNFRYSQKRQCNDCSSNKFTYEYVKNFIEIESGSNCRLINEEYDSATSKMDLECKCGTYFSTDFNQFKNVNKRQCNSCGNEMKNKSKMHDIEHVKKYIEDNTELLLVSSIYNGCKHPLEFKCTRCGCVFKQTFDRVKHGNIRMCASCSRKESGKARRLGYDFIKNFIETNSYCRLITRNQNILATDELSIRCECGEVFATTFQKFRYRDKRQCNDCGHRLLGKSLSKTHCEFVKEVEDIVGKAYTVVGKYTRSKNKVRLKHVECNHEWDVSPNGFLGGSRCPKCVGGIAYTDFDYRQKIKIEVGDEYSPIGIYVNTHTPVKIKHNTCGYVYKVRPANFFHGTRCPQCNESKGEQLIREYLSDNLTHFKQEFSFKDLVGLGGGALRFDFAVFSENSLSFLVEYDGIFHFEKQYDEDGFKAIQIHDERKDQYCKDNNIPLLRIPYWEFDNIEAMLEEWLSECGVLKKCS